MSRGERESIGWVAAAVLGAVLALVAAVAAVGGIWSSAGVETEGSP